MMGKDFDDLAEIKSERKGKADDTAAPVIQAKELQDTGTIRPFDISIKKESASALRVFWDQAEVNWYVQFMVQIKQMAAN